MSKRRTERLSDLLKHEISSIMLLKVHDPRLATGKCSITEVIMSSDYRHARVLVSVIGTETEREDSVHALNAASGFIRHELRKLDLKYIPTLTFVPDTGAEYSQHIEELLKTVKKDEEPQQ